MVKEVSLLEKTADVKIKATDAEKISYLKQLQTALELYYTDQNRYPVGNGVVLGSGNYMCFNEVGWAAAGCSMPYMSVVPKDPGNSSFIYTMLNGGKSYQIRAHLEGEFKGLSGDITVSPSGIAD